MILRTQVTTPFSNWIGEQLKPASTSGGGDGGFFGGLLNLLGLGGGSSAFAAGGVASSGFGTGSAFGNLDFGGLLANGAPAEPGKYYRVNARGPEMLNLNGEQFLMMGNQRGQVTPITSGGGGLTVHQTFILQNPASRDTQNQVASRALKGAQRALARTR